MPSQQSSFSGIRTEWMFQVFIASTAAWLTGLLSNTPLPCTQANSPLDMLTPSSRYVRPAAVRILLPDTCSAGAGPVIGGGLVGGVVGGLVVVVTRPVQATPLTLNWAGTGLPLARRVPMKPIDTDALVATAAFQFMAAAVMCAPDCDQVALQPLFRPWVLVGKSNASVQPFSASPRLVNETLAWKPSVHWLTTVYVAEQPLLAAPAGTVTTARPAATSNPAAPEASRA